MRAWETDQHLTRTLSLGERETRSARLGAWMGASRHLIRPENIVWARGDHSRFAQMGAICHSMGSIQGASVNSWVDLKHRLGRQACPPMAREWISWEMGQLSHLSPCKMLWLSHPIFKFSVFVPKGVVRFYAVLVATHAWTLASACLLGQAEACTTNHGKSPPELWPDRDAQSEPPLHYCFYIQMFKDQCKRNF